MNWWRLLCWSGALLSWLFVIPPWDGHDWNIVKDKATCRRCGKPWTGRYLP